MDPPEDFSAPRVRSLGNPDNGEEIHDGHSRNVVAITEATTGIGEATALQLAERGATLALGARGDSKILLHQRGARTTNRPLLDERVSNLRARVRADCLIRTAEETPKAEGFAAAPKTPPLCQGS
jgi:NAD(P)-dependent dehydrogenase (short-subunit alcohol dehydrogenase family)